MYACEHSKLVTPHYHFIRNLWDQNIRHIDLCLVAHLEHQEVKTYMSMYVSHKAPC